MSSQQYGQLTSALPVRRIGPGRRSLTGHVIVKGSAVPFESSLERDFLVLLDFDRTVVEVRSQPVRIKYQDGKGRRLSYVPDYQVRYDFTPDVIYEIKYREDLRADWAKLRPRLRAGVGYARRNGMRFSIMTDVEIRGPYLKNVQFLRSYRDRPFDELLEQQLVRTLAMLGEATPEALLLAAFRNEEKRLAAIGALWRLLAVQRVHADLYRPLTMETPIWVVTGEGFLP